jgi:nicotinate-nucleotide adenylyltransferase
VNDSPDIIIFGGTFDPPHAGHQNCIRLAQTMFPGVRILMVPAMMPPGAGQPAKQPVLTFEERMNLCRLAFPEPGVEISDIESTLPVPNYTVHTIAALKLRFPGKSPGLLIGMDQFQHFLSWHQPFTIAEQANLLVVGREDTSENSRVQFNRYLDNLTAAYKNSSGGHSMKQVYFLPGLTSDASSTILRETLATGRDAPAGWLAPSVETYIKQKNIYSGDHPS